MLMMPDDDNAALRRILEELVADACASACCAARRTWALYWRDYWYQRVDPGGALDAAMAHDLVVGIMQRLAAAGLEIRRRD
jgi:hypothetical protein